MGSSPALRQVGFLAVMGTPLVRKEERFPMESPHPELFAHLVFTIEDHCVLSAFARLFFRSRQMPKQNSLK